MQPRCQLNNFKLRLPNWILWLIGNVLLNSQNCIWSSTEWSRIRKDRHSTWTTSCYTLIHVPITQKNCKLNGSMIFFERSGPDLWYLWLPNVDDTFKQLIAMLILFLQAEYTFCVNHLYIAVVCMQFKVVLQEWPSNCLLILFVWNEMI